MAGGVDNPDETSWPRWKGANGPPPIRKERLPAEPPRKRSRLGMLEDLVDVD